MNAIQLDDRIDFYNNLTGNARFSRTAKAKSVNDNIRIFIDKICNQDGLQRDQDIRDNLFTLIASASVVLTDNAVKTTRAGQYRTTDFPRPADYYTYFGLETLIDGYTSYVKPIDYNSVGPWMDNVYQLATNKKTYFNESASVITIYRGIGGTFSSAILEYIKIPDVFSLGLETDVITEGLAVLTIGLDYIALEDGTVENGITYASGTQFTAATVDLTTGSVILASKTTTTNLPPKVHEVLAKMASDSLMGVIADIPKTQLAGRELAKDQG